MLQQYLADQFESALIQLKYEINNYTHKEKMWKLKGDIKNSGGTLALHLIGNLRHFIGTTLGNTGFVRNRDAEFNDRDVPSS
ncbi:MAG: DinB superfamily protein, partial [Chitinophagales bacterium]